MKLVLPLLLLPLGPAGVVIGLLVGILLDEVLYAVLIVKAAQALARGKPFPWFPGFPVLAVTEMALLVVVDVRHPDTAFERYQELRDWQKVGGGELRNRRFLAQAARVWAGLFQVADRISLEFLLEQAVQKADGERRHDFFGMLVHCASIDRDGTDLDDLVLLHRLAIGLDLPVLAFHQSLTSHFRLNRDACAILGVPTNASRDAVMAAGRALLQPESQATEALIRRSAFSSLEDQLDAIERMAERYRQATLREQR